MSVTVSAFLPDATNAAHNTTSTAYWCCPDSAGSNRWWIHHMSACPCYLKQSKFIL